MSCLQAQYFSFHHRIGATNLSLLKLALQRGSFTMSSGELVRLECALTILKEGSRGKHEY